MNNISLDHKSLDELRTLFRGFIAKARIAVLNLDNAETAALAAELKRGTGGNLQSARRTSRSPRLYSGPVADRHRVQVKARDSGRGC